MAARDHFGPQLQFFIPAGAFEEAAREDPNLVQFADAAAYPYVPEDADEKITRLKALKIAESRVERWGRPAVRDSIAESRQVNKPVDLKTRFVRDYPRGKNGAYSVRNRFVVDDGHHRVFAAASVDPGMEIPVRYF